MRGKRSLLVGFVISWQKSGDKSDRKQVSTLCEGHSCSLPGRSQERRRILLYTMSTFG